jgi:hypothetical protein
LDDETLIPLGFFIMLSIVFWMQKTYSRDRLGKVAEVQKHLMDKFQSGRELAEFMETEAGRGFVAQIQGSAASPFGGSLASLRWGLVSAFLGVGCLVLQQTASHGADTSMQQAGVVFLSVGIALICAGALSRYLSRKWSAEDAASSASLGGTP